MSISEAERSVSRQVWRVASCVAASSPKRLLEARQPLVGGISQHGVR